MSVSFYANIVAGFEIPSADLLVSKTRSGCSHPKVAGNNFCGVCGKPVEVVETETLQFENTSCGNTNYKFSLEFANTTDFEDNANYAVAGLKLTDRFSKQNVTSFDPAQLDFVDIEKRLREDLEAAGIVVKTKFAVHVVKYVSY